MRNILLKYFHLTFCVYLTTVCFNIRVQACDTSSFHLKIHMYFKYTNG